MWHMIMTGSRSLSVAKNGYAIMELELLVIICAIKKCDVFIRGMPDVHCKGSARS